MCVSDYANEGVATIAAQYARKKGYREVFVTERVRPRSLLIDDSYLAVLNADQYLNLSMSTPTTIGLIPTTSIKILRE